MLSSHVKGWRCGKLMSIQQIAAKPALCFNQDYYSQQQKWMFKSISRCFTWCSSNSPASWASCFRFLYISTTQWQMWRFQFSKQFISSGALEVKSNKFSKCNKCSCITQVHRYTLLKSFTAGTQTWSFGRWFSPFSSKWFFFGSMFIFPGISYRLGMRVAHKTDSSHQDDLNGIWFGWVYRNPLLLNG